MDDTLDRGATVASPYGDELPPGTELCQGQYTILRYINSGGFGVTYLANDSLGRKVVIKECFPGSMCCRANGTVRLRTTSHEMDFGRVVELFEREARALAQLSHPNIVGVHQIFKDNGTAYMAMDFIEGPDLFDVLETKPELLEPDEIRRILDHLLKALSFVHENGMLHRDISPDNILLGPGGLPVLIDFGAAREGAARATRMLSRIHTVKDGYSPQEFYLAGSSQEKSSDLYALAATVHHLIRGCPPPNSNIRLAAVAQDEPDPYQPLAGRMPGYDENFLRAIDTCLSLFAKDRMETAEDWIATIGGTAVTPAATDSLVTDDVKKRISELVSETTASIEKAQSSEPKTVEHEVPEPVCDKDAAQKEYWAILNEDPAEIRAEIERAEALQRQIEEEEARARAEADEADDAEDAGTRRKSSKLSQWFGSFFAARREDGLKPAMQPLKE